MYRGTRETGKWFSVDHKPMIADRAHASTMGPGKYDSNHKQVSKEQISWNLGKIPFGSGDERFRTDYRAYFRPGPGMYNPDQQASSLSQLVVDAVSQGGQSIRKLSPRQQEILALQQTSNFKSNALKVSIYKDEEKRLRDLHGPKKNLKYQIKLNDEILDKQKKSQSLKENMGKLKLGPNFAEEKPEEPIERNKDLFGVRKQNKMGPQDYDPIIQGKSSPQVVIKNKSVLQGATGSIKKQMEDYLGNIFEQKATDRSKNQTQEPPSTTQPKSLDQIAPFTVDKRDVTFKSKIPRDPLEPSKMQKVTPGPTTYNPKKPQKELLQGRNYAQFGTNAKRNDLIRRDMATMPFGDPTFTKSPSPDKYHINETNEKKKLGILQQVGSSLGVPDINMTNSFYSPVQRDFMDQVSKEHKTNPGPGQYDTQIQDKLKVLNYQLSTRYHLKPFGSGSVRFEYQQPQPQNKRATIDFNQMISVKDKDVELRRSAFLQTIQHHKDIANQHQSAVFSSTAQRFGNTPSGAEESTHYQDGGVQYRTASGAFETTKSTFGLTFQKGGSGTQIKNHQNISFQRENPSYGFNSTQQRFSYMKEMQKMGENPGPGSYDNMNDHTTIAGSTMAVPINNALNTVSSTGGGAFFHQKSTDGNGSPSLRVAPHQKFSTIGTSMFKNSTSREDFKHYIPKNTNNTIALKNLGPGTYFKSKSPFLKRSFNASLPPSKFY